METSTEEFEPYCSWKIGKDFDTIEIDLDGFGMDDVKLTKKCSIEEENSTISIFTTESSRRLQKKIEIPNKDYDVENLRAIFYNGTLSVELPKKAASNRLDISKEKLEIRKVLGEFGGGVQKIFTSGVEFSSKPIVAASGFIIGAIALLAYKYCVIC